jgi:hypothetical protein
MPRDLSAGSESGGSGLKVPSQLSEMLTQLKKMRLD